MNGGPAGFENAPVVKALFVTTTGSSILWQAARFDLVEPLHPLLRSFIQSFVFRNTGELIFGVGLLYSFRILERQTGSSKFGGYSFMTIALSYGLQTAIQIAYGFKNIPTGPYGFLFASFLKFMFDIPTVRRFSFFGIPLSDKAFTYLMGLQLMFANGTGSMMAALCGILAGFTYRSNILGIQRFRFPSFVNQFLSKTVGRILGANSARPIITVNTTRSNRHRRHTPNGTAETNPTRRMAVAVSEDAVRQLVGMGFSERSARAALQTTNNDVQSAIAMLVDQS